MKIFRYFLLALALIALDQAVKMWVHFNMDYGQAGQIPVFGEWFKLHYTLNPGMAFGMQLGSDYGKLVLTLFRIVASGAIAWYLYYLAKNHKAHQGFIWCMAMILAGAIGNVIDSTFYGVWLNNAPNAASTPWFHGQVIDMFYLDIWEGYLPDWIPFWGGKYTALWPIFNVADASIFVGVGITLIFQGTFFGETEKQETEEIKAE
ncbi:lipoprotein signal peptidase [Cytophagales bacterium LB-30]|uniref:Lipoprotein signal peptidase n=1 Tax=Shiella aurantiaca TaxID=3058365 RepID=A0ABT8F5T8_9BACT|nr:lipoprotein signal peptidase [Shiella aurantiaca]MDN4165797.1 lipoprotein signal peptidase [Shiella aurantiaca]